MIRGLPGGVRVVCGSGALGARGATGGIRGKLTRHSGTQRIRASGRYSGVSGHVAARRAPGGILLFRHPGTDGKLGRHPGEILPVWGIRGHVAAREESGRGGVSLGTQEHVAGSEGVSKGLSEGFAAGLRGHKSFSKESFGSTFGTRGAFRRKDRRVWFEGVSKGAFGEMASGTGGDLRRTVRQSLRRKLRKEAFGRASGRFRKAPKGFFRGHVSGSEEGSSKGFPRGSSGLAFEGWPSGLTITVRLGIYG